MDQKSNIADRKRGNLLQKVWWIGSKSKSRIGNPILEKTISEPSSDEYTVRVAKEPEEIKELLETRFEYVCKKEELVFLRECK